MRKVRLKAFALCVTFAVAAYYSLGLLLDTNLHVKSKADTFQPPLLRHKEGWYGGQTLLDELGFVDKPRLFPQAYHDDENIPVVITAASSAQFTDVMLFVKSLRLYFPEKRLVIYNLGLSSVEKETVRNAVCSAEKWFPFGRVSCAKWARSGRAFRSWSFEEN